MKKSINRKIYRNIYYGITAILLAYTLLAYNGTLAAAKTSGGFNIEAIIPENQIDKKQTYFDLGMNPGDTQDIEIVISNSGSAQMEALVKLNAASTGRNGLIVYTEPEIRDEGMEYSITDIATLSEERINIAPQSSEKVKISLKMPEKDLKGIILGGIAVTDIGSGENEEKQGVTLKNTITYVTALKLRVSEQEEAPDFLLASINPTLVNYRTAVSVSLKNTSPRIIKHMEIDAQIYKKGSEDILNQLYLKDAEMAPQSEGEFIVDWNDQPLRAGNYRLKMTAIYEGQKWQWDEEFSIAGEADTINNNALGLKKDYTWLYILLGIIVLALVVIVSYMIGKRAKKMG